VEPSHQNDFAELLKQSGRQGEDPLLIAGSTHDGEEEILTDCLLQWREKHPHLRLIVAPRHVERVPSLLRHFAKTRLKIVLRSSLPSAAPWDIMLLDTTGELCDWYAFATVAFVGKSLTAHGGQNPVEPALAGKPVVFGPHMENFESIVDLLLAGKGALQARSREHMAELVDMLLSDAEARSQLGSNAMAVLALHQGSSKRTAQLILRTAENPDPV
jgi:3-deoxy-D-manno-octulosonic-acid transferase